MHKPGIAILATALLIVSMLLCSIATANQDAALVEAAGKGDLKRVQELVGHGADVDTKDKDGGTLLMMASDKGHLEIVRLLLEKGANVNAKDKNGRTALAIAVEQGDSRKDVTELLLDKGADPAGGLDGLAAISERSLQPPHGETLELIINRVANVNIRLKGGHPHLGETLLIWALGPLSRVPTDLVKRIIDKGADVNASDETGGTPLIAAISNGNEQLVMLLLEKGADVNARTRNGWTALMGATLSLNVVKALLERGADVNARDHCGYTPLMSAADGGGIDVVKLLLGKGADINARNTCGWTVLMYAAEGGDSEVVKFLLDKGLDVNTRDSEHRTALWHALKHRRAKTIELLKAHGAKE